MFALASGKKHTGLHLDNQVLMTESRVTIIDALLATSVLLKSRQGGPTLEHDAVG
jgi:hypothetical protein